MVLGGGASGLDYELDRHPGLRVRLFGCGSAPSIPPSDYVVTTGSLQSSAMHAAVPWEVAMPRSGHGEGPLPLVLALPGEGGNQHDFATGNGLLGYATAAGMRMCFVSVGDVGSTYYHPRTDGTDYFSFIVEELLPTIEQRFQVGGSRARRGVYGWSMGGFGALLIAQKRPELICAAVGSSPAVFPSYDAAITGHPATFDSAADWARWGVWDHAATMGRVPVRIDCGEEDPFGATANALLRRIPGAIGQVGSGCHKTSFWRRTATTQLQFLASQLGASSGHNDVTALRPAQ